MSSYTISETVTFSVTHARHIAAKVATDLKRVQRFYRVPSDADIAAYEAELVLMLKAGFLETVSYGFRKDGAWIEPTLCYSGDALAADAGPDDDPGRILPGRNVTGAGFHSFLTYNGRWHSLSEAEKEAFRRQLPFRRGVGPRPAINGYLQNDLVYSAGGRALRRASVRAY